MTSKVMEQLTVFTYPLEWMRQDNQIRGIQTIDEVHVQPGEDEIGRSDQRIGEVHVLPGEDEQIRGIYTIEQVHVRSGENGIG